LPWIPWNINNLNPQFNKAHLTTVNLNNFNTIEAVGLKVIYCIEVPLNGITSVPDFKKILPSGSSVISGEHTDRQRETGDLISLLSFF
jgi:hypothetical protein